MGFFKDVPRSGLKQEGVITNLSDLQRPQGMQEEQSLKPAAREAADRRGRAKKSAVNVLPISIPSAGAGGLTVTDDPDLDNVGPVTSPSPALADPMRAVAAINMAKTRSGIVVTCHPKWFEGIPGVGYRASNPLPETASEERRAIHTAIIKTAAALGMRPNSQEADEGGDDPDEQEGTEGADDYGK
jgi:hypothetical protein